MSIRSNYRVGRAFAAVGSAALLAAVPAFASDYYYVNWTSADVAGGTASGTIDLDGDASMTVSFTAVTEDASPGDLYGAQIDDAGTNYWTPATTWMSAAVENAPPGNDIIQLEGGDNDTYIVTLSQPVVDPIMAIVSLGAGGDPITYNFNAPFTIVSQGTDDWDGPDDGGLVQLPNNVLQGAEGSGTIQFIGTFRAFSWTVPTPESWHGFTFGILNTAALYDGGGPDGSATPVNGSSEDASEDASIESNDASANDAGGTSADAGVGTPDDASEATPDSGTVTGPITYEPAHVSDGCSCSTVSQNAGTSRFPVGLVALVLGVLSRRRSLARKSRAPRPL